MAAESLCKACGKIPLLSLNGQRNDSSSIANNCGQGACKAQFRKGKHMFLSAALPYSSSLHHNFAASPSYFRSSSSIKSARKMDTVCEQKVKVHFILKHQVRFGEHHAILGSAKALGKWKKKTMMSWTESGWVYDLETDGGERIEYKFVIVSDSGKLIWESGENRVLELPREGSFQVACQWDNTGEVIELNAMGSNVGTSKAVDSRKKLEQGNGKPNIVTANKAVENSPFLNEWQGRQTSFMRSNDHSNREQQRVWNTTGLQGPASKLVEGDQRARNWWRKLDIVRELLTGEAGKNDRFEALINSAIYLKWINTGQIPCFEDGGHYRPNKHAEISRSIFCELEAIVSESTATPQEVLVIRKIHPCLPSFKSEFTASVPLTRIRDIAHRNDIPHDLKQEIKHTIQNKLHRNAGPEDLIATEAMLKRVTNRPGEYSEAFVEQLKIFFNELKDFFNAGSLTEQLDAIKSSLDQQGISALTAFLDSKKRMDQLDLNNNTSSDKVMEELTRTLHTLTGLRVILVKELQTGLKNDSSATAIATHQKWRLSEIGLEDYSFVLLSRFVNALEAGGGSSQLIREAKLRNSSSWDHPIGALVTAIRQLGLSGWRQSECIAIENELQCWQQKGITKNEGKEDGVIIWALRMKATLDRVCRFTESYSDTLLQIFPDKVQKLGKAFGIPENTVRTYTEAEIRASVVFQISKLCSLLLKSVRSVSGSHGWDTLVPGKAFGTLLEVEKIVPGSLPPALTGPIILIVRKADGDEEVKAAGENIAGVVLLQELPHLSHLGVRARQEKVVFVTCEDEDQIANLRKLRNQFVRIEASSEKVEVVASSSLEQNKELVTAGVKNTLAENIIGSETGKKKNHTKPAGGGNGSQSQVIKRTSNTVLKLDSASMDSCGAKATSCGRLAVLAGLSAKVVSNHGVSASFRVPKGIVIPFGAMEAALESSGSLKRYQSLIEQIENAKLGGGGLDALCSELQVLIAAQRPSKPALDSIAKSFSSDARLIVRSSANVEDLAGMSGAGLYDSIPNVRASEIETFGKAVAQVWASLYTRRAVLSRRVAGVPQREATMAVLVQEMLAPELSFVLHTVSPVDRNESVVEAEIAPGLGETLASGTRGTPWRLAGNKFDATVKTQAFANFSEELAVVTGGAADGNVKKLIVDYSKKPLTVDPIFRQQFGQRLATIGFFIEQKFACPQDIEGCLVGNDVFIVQARPQP